MKLLEPHVPFFQRQLHLELVPVSFSAHSFSIKFRERFEQGESNVYRLKIFRLGVRNITGQRAGGTQRRSLHKRLLHSQPRRIHTCNPTHRH